MASNYFQIGGTDTAQTAWTLSGSLKSFSTEELHIHSYHQILTIRDGVSLLVDEARKQPLFGSMAACIPACLPHRSIVIGEAVKYKSIYLSPGVFELLQTQISIFGISSLSSALLDRIEINRPADLSRGLNRECLDLLLKTLPLDMERPADLVRLPEPHQPLTKDVTGFIEKNYGRRLTMDDFTAAFPYSSRHLSRLFKADMTISIFEYLRLYRILMASIDMHDPGRSITRIALDCGYESLSSFYRDFNLIYASTPKAFRNSLT